MSARDYLSEVLSDVEVTAGNVTDVGPLRLRTGGVVLGKVLDPGGAAVAGASVYANFAGQMRPGARDHQSVSDSEGYFEIRGLPDGPLELVAQHPSYAEGRSAGVDIDAEMGSTDVEIILKWGGHLEGYVRSRDGMGIPGRMIRVSVDGSGRGFGFGGGGTDAETGADGHFRAENLPMGLARVELFGDASGALVTAVAVREVEIFEGQTAYVEFEARRVLVQGQVTRHGAPVAGGHLNLRGSAATAMMFIGRGATPTADAGPQLQYAQTRADGSFELYVEQPGEFTASLNLSESVSSLPSQPVTIPDVDVHSVSLDFGGTVIRGFVMDQESSEPVGEASVSARPPAASGLSGSSTRALADGTFELELEPGAYELITRAEGYTTDERSIEVASDGSTRSMRIGLDAARYIEGRVFETTGRAVGGMFVRATPSGPSASEAVSGAGARTLADGSFQLEGLARQPYNLLTGSELAGYAFARNIRPGTRDVDMQLTPGGRVYVVVQTEDGTPAGGVSVSVTALDGAAARGFGGTTGPSGVTQFSTPAGSVELTARQGELAGQSVVSVAPGGEVPAEIVLR